MCSFTDKKVSEFIQAKKHWDGHHKTKKAVSRVGRQENGSRVGRQENGSWVLNKEVIVGVSGQQVSLDTSPYIWIGHLVEGPGIAKSGDAIAIEEAVNGCPEPLVQALRSILKHNFFPGMLVLSSITQEDKERARNEIEGKPVRIMEEEEGHKRMDEPKAE